METVECPYCEHEQGLETSEYRDEDNLQEEECESCDKKFGVRLSITYDYYPEKVDCWNGVSHKWSEWRVLLEDHQDHPNQVFRRRHCEECDESESGWFDMGGEANQ